MKNKNANRPAPPAPPAPPPPRDVRGRSTPNTFSVGYGKNSQLLRVIEKLESGKFPELTYVSKQYTKADLIRDLRDLLEG